MTSTDAWGRPIVTATDGHSAWSCNDRECTIHPDSLYGAPVPARNTPHTLTYGEANGAAYSVCSCGWISALHHFAYPNLSAELQAAAYEDAQAAAVEEGADHLAYL